MPDQTRFALLIALVILLLFYLIFRRTMARKMARPKPARIAPSEEDRLRNDLEKILVEIQELSRGHIAAMDGKIRLLNSLIVEADQKAHDLRDLVARAEQAMHGARSSSPPAPAPARPQNPLHTRIFECVDKGMDVLSICRETGLEKGEVELILGLRRLS